MLNVHSTPFIGCLLATCLLVGADAKSTEIEFKARAIKSVVFFTNFPASNPPDRPWIIGFVGGPLIGKAMEVVAPPGTLMKGRLIQITYPRSRTEVEAVDALFIGASEKDRLSELLQWVKGRNILTIGDTEHFINTGTMIHLAVEGDRIRPWVNVKPAQDSGLSFSSFFLANAKLASPQPKSEDNP